MTTQPPNKPKRRTYSAEFKELLVQEAEGSGRSIASIARDHGIKPQYQSSHLSTPKSSKNLLGHASKSLVGLLYIRQSITLIFAMLIVDNAIT